MRRMLALAILLLGAATPAAAQTQADLFDDTRLHTVEIVMHSRDWSDLQANFRSNDQYPCDVIWNGVRMRNVAVRSRGNGSRYQAKPGLELSFDHYATQQRFIGLQTLEDAQSARKASIEFRMLSLLFFSMLLLINMVEGWSRRYAS